MGRLVAVVAVCLSLVLASVTPMASAEPDVQPVGSVPIPDRPAPAWIVADMDTGQVLAGRGIGVSPPPRTTPSSPAWLTPRYARRHAESAVACPPAHRPPCSA